MRVCKEWGSLLLNEEVKVVCKDQGATDWIGEYFSNTGFMAQAQATVVRAFELGTGAWAVWVSASSSSPSTSSPSPEHADALLAMNDEESYKIVTACFDKDGNELEPAGITPVYDTGYTYMGIDRAGQAGYLTSAT